MFFGRFNLKSGSEGAIFINHIEIAVRCICVNLLTDEHEKHIHKPSESSDLSNPGVNPAVSIAHFLAISSKR